jgi:hypothetical protein
VQLLGPFRYLIQFRFEYRFASLIQSRIAELEDIVDGFHRGKIGKIQNSRKVWIKRKELTSTDH